MSFKPNNGIVFHEQTSIQRIATLVSFSDVKMKKKKKNSANNYRAAISIQAKKRLWFLTFDYS